MLRARPTALLVDLDGVLRRWDPEVPAGIEAAHGLPAGALEKTAMDWSRLLPAITGQVTHAGWMAGVAEALGAPEAVAEWQRYRGEVDPDVLAFVREARAAGVPVAIATNATDQLDADLAALGLTGEVDAVVNSSVVGAHKPTREFFTAACHALGPVGSGPRSAATRSDGGRSGAFSERSERDMSALGRTPGQVLLVDDSDRFVRGARVAGLSAYRWNGPADLPYLRAALGLA